ncbi:MAG: nuclear transport factor 2 family protein [Saprospiraceae bacterium]|nr:nuclear transport factor 2 family protein [Saprospiraceae bacterium]MBK6815031.1 nuclear transport factor 2 family protein [Saprospiraceae bacterium]MBK8282110.1 nuclear transport factor 2 family protein [Saprospiraceae bacterium]MBK8777990.1 nuclear transport factor 2 family protein [Saprospiraceae bacterium]
MESKPTQTTINIQLIKKNNCPMKNYIFYIAVFSISIGSVYSQESEFNSQEIFYELRQKDSLVFNLGFNHCDSTQLRMLLSDDLEFYHDQNGILKSKEILIQSIPNLCKMDYKPIRVLIDNSLQVFPLFSNGKIYGAIQTGIHEFYGEEKDKPRYLTSTAKFTHVWIIEGGEWKLKRILSYDHVIPRK